MNNCKSLAWNDVYNLGHDKVDQEHKKLFELSNQIALCGTNRVQFVKAVQELIKYTKYHFTNEEKFMESINFKFLDEHKQLHKNIVDNLNDFLKQLDKFSIEEFSKKLLIFVKENIINHILTEDKRVHHLMKDTEKLKQLFEWKDIYKIDNDLIDNEHKKLFTIAIEALNTNVDDRKLHIRKTLIELNEYMKTHFNDEENYMKEIQYKEFKHHKKLHENIITQMNEFIKQLPGLSIEQFERKLIEYMDIWLINHIVTEDRKIVCSETDH